MVTTGVVGLSTRETLAIHSSKLCDEMRPCLNTGICREDVNDLRGYICECQIDYKGIHCEKDDRICHWKSCSNNGKKINC